MPRLFRPPHLLVLCPLFTATTGGMKGPTPLVRAVPPRPATAVPLPVLLHLSSLVSRSLLPVAALLPFVARPSLPVTPPSQPVAWRVPLLPEGIMPGALPSATKLRWPQALRLSQKLGVYGFRRSGVVLPEDRGRR